MPERTEVDGIPTFWAPAPGTFRAALHFRVGVADEAPPTRGITHLVEHLAMFGSDARTYEANGFVDLERCVFYATGDRDEVLAWLSRCAAALADLPLDRLATERRILRAEAAGGEGGGIQARLLDLRFGGRGYGLANFRELGLRWLAEEDVAGWARTRFNRANASLWMTDEPPASLELALPDGERNPPPPVEPMSGVSDRQFVADGTGGVAVGGLGRRSTPLHAALMIGHERLYQRLRLDLGLVYEAWSNYERLGADHVHTLMGAECPDERAGQVAAEVWRVISELAESGVTAEELDRHRALYSRSREEPDSVLGELDHWASQELLGAPAVTSEDVARELEETTPEQIASVVAEAFEDAIFIVASGVEGVEGFTRYEVEPPEAVGGTVYTYDPRFYGPGFEIRVGERGLTIIEHGKPTVTLEWADIVLGEWAPADTLILMARDGSWIELRFAAIQGDDARRDVLDHLPEGVLVPVGNLEATEALQDLVKAMPDEAEVAAELAALPRELGEDEVPEAVLQYRHNDERRGLLALTNERLIRWYLAGDDSDGETIPRGAIRGVEVRKRLLRAAVLVVEHEGAMEVKVDDAAAAESFAAKLDSEG
ncbi:MAG TPA: insulinase family protein [Solirubrobacteraceae bacterium]|nr:insulinase family protein [Solirubrobacteraceae bacterium]